jgi:Protein of unknown function (DUF3014)
MQEVRGSVQSAEDIMDDTPLPDDLGDRPLFTSRRRWRRSRARVGRDVAYVLLLLAAIAAGWWWRHGHEIRDEAQTGPAPATAGNPASAPASAAPPGGEVPDLPTVERSDAFVRPLVAGLSARPELGRWLVTDDLVHRFVLSVVDVANGQSPASQLAFLKPKRDFRAREAEGSLVMDTATYHRYDALTLTVVSLDIRGTAELYQRLSPLLEKDFGELGLPDQTFQGTLARAFGQLLAVRYPQRPPELTRRVVSYEYASPQLRSLSPVAKHMLRLGPDNGRQVQAKLEELADAMGIVPVPPPTPGKG